MSTSLLVVRKMALSLVYLRHIFRTAQIEACHISAYAEVLPDVISTCSSFGLERHMSLYVSSGQ